METPSPIQNFYIMKSVMFIDESYENIKKTFLNHKECRKIIIG